MSSRSPLFLFLLPVLFTGGCTGPSPAEIGEMEVAMSLGIVILSWPMVVVLTLLTKRLNLSRVGRFWLQYLIYFILSILLIILQFKAQEEVIRFQVLSVVALPYLLFATSLLLLILPSNFLAYIPSVLLLTHFVMSGLLYVTDSEFLLALQPILIVVELWPLTMPAAVFILVYLLIQRKHTSS